MEYAWSRRSSKEFEQEFKVLELSNLKILQNIFVFF